MQSLQVFFWPLKMKINELLEGTSFNDLDFLENTPTGRQINFDLANDLVYFMHENDDIYRKYTYPAILKYAKLRKQHSNAATVFKTAVIAGYAKYLREFPIRELPDQIDRHLLHQACQTLGQVVDRHVRSGQLRQE